MISFKTFISEDMSGMSVKSGHKRPVDKGAGMTKKGVAAYRRRNPGSKLQTAVTAKPSRCTFALAQWIEERNREVYPKMKG